MVKTKKVNTIGQACTERNKNDIHLYSSANEIFTKVIEYWNNNEKYAWNLVLSKSGIK